MKKPNSPKQEEELKKQKTVKAKLQKEAVNIRKQFAKKTLNLMTSGFGLVAALAWNEVIKETVDIYIKPYFGQSSGLISLVIYAVIVTALAVTITYQLGKIADIKKE